MDQVDQGEFMLITVRYEVGGEWVEDLILGRKSCGWGVDKLKHVFRSWGQRILTCVSEFSTWWKCKVRGLVLFWTECGTGKARRLDTMVRCGG